jgi:hypothetical protein
MDKNQKNRKKSSRLSKIKQSTRLSWRGLIFAGAATAAIGVYFLIHSFAATSSTEISITVVNYRRGSTPIAGAVVHITNPGSTASPCHSGIYSPGIGVTGSNGRVTFVCDLGGYPWYTAQLYSVAKTGYAQDPASPLKVGDQFINYASQATNKVYYMSGNPDGDGLYDYGDKCPDWNGPSATGGCPTPVMTLKANNVNGNISLAQGSALTLAWSSTYATSCTASGSWVGAKALSSAGENHTSDTAAPKILSYTLKCANPGTSATATRAVIVTAKPAPPPPPSPTASPSHPSPSPSPSSPGRGGSPPARTTPSQSVGSSNDTTPPSAPTNVTAESDSSGEIKLSWDASNDNLGVNNYVVERSTDQSVWQKLDDSVTFTTYTDLSVDFGAHYYYRISAQDAAGNTSGYGLTDIIADNFEANAHADQDNSIISDDNVVNVSIPSGALDNDAVCNIAKVATSTGALGNKAAYLIGPYQLSCKTSDNKTITTFLKPITFTVSLSSNQAKKANPVLYELISSKWTTNPDKKLIVQNDAVKFETTSPNVFAVKGEKKSSNILVWFSVLLITGITVFILWKLFSGLKNRTPKEEVGIDPAQYVMSSSPAYHPGEAESKTPHEASQPLFPEDSPAPGEEDLMPLDRASRHLDRLKKPPTHSNKQ